MGQLDKKALIVRALAEIMLETIQDAGEQGIPSGHLYAALTGHMDLEAYQRIIAILKEQNLIKEKFHVLTAVKEDTNAV